MPYFDYNATAPLFPQAREAWLAATTEHWQNPSSPYRAAARAHNALETARAQLADWLSCAPEAIVFTSGATEANNAVLSFYARTHPLGMVAISAVEHPCVLEAAKRFFPERVQVLPVDANGVVELEALEAVLAGEKPALVSLMAANNETGALQPWQEAAELCRQAGVAFHCDAAQWLGKMPLDGLGKCPLLTGCAHKFGGPKGVGFLKISDAAQGLAEILGGGQEHGHRGGTENLPGVCAMVAALEKAENQRQQNAVRLDKALQDFLQRTGEGIPGLKPTTPPEHSLWNTLSLQMPVGENVRWVRKLDKRGFEVSTGSACAAGKEAPSHVLAAMGLSSEAARRVIRISGGWETQPADWASLADTLIAVYDELKNEPGSAEVIEL